MLNNTTGIIKIVLSILFFPIYFQAAFIHFAWGSGDPMWLLTVKRILLLLPAGAILLGCWASIACLLTVPIRQKRQEFVTALFVTWWDLGKSILSFWGGLLQFIANLFVTMLGMMRIAMLAVWSLVHDVIFMPVSLIKQAGKSVIKSPIPWIAVTLTLAWCLVETSIFTYVMSPLVIDTFSNITGETMSEAFVHVPLFLFLFFVVLGSYAVLSTFVDSFKTKSISTVIRISAIEMVVIFVEVVFLYREFVDSLVPWFAQYSENFELGVFWTLTIAGFVWFGIRSLSWFLFASHGTPTIMAVIQGRGVSGGSKGKRRQIHVFDISGECWRKIKSEASWMKEKREDLLSSFMLPPLQVVAAGLNFCTLCVINQHLFLLPFKDMKAIRYSEELIKRIKHESQSLTLEPATKRSRPKESPAFEPEAVTENIPKPVSAEDDILQEGVSKQVGHFSEIPK